MTSKFRAQHYNAIAKDIREQMAKHGVPHIVKSDYHVGARNALIEISLRLAMRFERDNERFNPLLFLDACSPDPEQYPLSELWDDREELLKKR
jgi:hypothetical protein